MRPAFKKAERTKVEPAEPVRRVLIYRLGSLGDTVVALPSLHLLARRFPLAERRLLTNYPVHAKAPAAAAVLGDSGLVHGYLRYSVGTRNPWEFLRLARAIRRFAPDLLVYLMPLRSLQNVRRDARFFRWACGVRQIAGLPGPDELHHRYDAVSDLYESEAARLARSLAALGDAQADGLSQWDLLLSETERQSAAQALLPLAGRSFLVCGPGTKMQAKDWGQENWRALLEKLHRRYPQYALALVGAREDRAVGEWVAQGWNAPSLNLCGELTPRQTAAVIAQAAVFLGPDSGPMHLAASVGTPSVIAFSARGYPGIWFPAGQQHQVFYHRTECRGCNLETCTEQDRRCLKAISVEAMAAAAERVLGAPEEGFPEKGREAR
jgi:ADP-heptose:LPS heptosyltransferase